MPPAPKWDDASDRELLLAICQLCQVNPNWDQVAEAVGRTRESVRQRYQKKLLKLAPSIPSAKDKTDTEDGTEDGAEEGAIPKTPRTPASKKRGAKSQDGSPAKKSKSRGKKAVDEVKTEHDSEEYYDF